MADLSLNFLDFEKNPHALVDAILNHRKNSPCTKCVWYVAVVGKDKLREVDSMEKNCMLSIQFDLHLVRNDIILLMERYNFRENVQFRPLILDMQGMVMVYCE